MLFTKLSLQNIVEEVNNMLVEKRIVLASTNKKYLFQCMACLNQLLYPLRWVLKMVPILPLNTIKEVNDMLECPQGYIFGVYCCTGIVVPENATLINIDNNTITNPLQIPNCDTLIEKLNKILSQQSIHPYNRDVTYMQRHAVNSEYHQMI